jgi:hypothetical protein
LQTRSKAIRTALEQYNKAALALGKSELVWEDVVEYTFLSEFDLLHSACREDISQKPWATRLGRLALDQHFKQCRAQEEIERLNVEIRRFTTFIRDQDNYLRTAESLLQSSNPILAYHVSEYRLHRTRFDSVHLTRLSKLSRLTGFTGSLLPGTALSTAYRHATPLIPTPSEAREGGANADDDDDDDDDVEAQILGLISMSTDPTVA